MVNLGKPLDFYDDAHPDTLGENGNPAYAYSSRASLEGKIAAYYNFLSCEEKTLSEIRRCLHCIIKELQDDEQFDIVIRTLFLMVFSLRDPRSGRGKIQNSHFFFLCMYEMFTEDATAALKLFKNHGSMKDYRMLWEMVQPKDDDVLFEPMRKEIVNIYSESIQRGCVFAAKWAPRQKSKHSSLCRHVRRKLRMDPKTYRKTISALNCGVIESYMCSGQWSKIDHRATCAGSNLKYRKALRCEGTNTCAKFIQDRQECRKNLDAYLKSGKTLHGSGGITAKTIVCTYAFCNWDSVYTYDDEGQLSFDFDPVIESQWTNHVSKIKDQGTLNNTFAMVDVSGSMFDHGAHTISAAIGIGLMVESCCDTGGIITFSDKPQKIDFEDCPSLCDKIKKLSRCEWGMNTNFEAAYMLILRMLILAAEQKKYNNEEQVTLLVLSDMQFDKASDKKSSFGAIKELFNYAKIPVPKIIYWNLRNPTRQQYQRFETKEHEINVVEVSGYSSSILETIIKGPNTSSSFGLLQQELNKKEYADVITMFGQRAFPREGLV